MKLLWRFLLGLVAGWSLGAAERPLEWSVLPPLPKSIGVAGPFAGVHDDVLIIAGGANFPKGLPWETTTNGLASPPKVYHDRIFAISRNGRQYQHEPVRATLKQAAAYGVSLPHPEGVLCIGGDWKTHDKNATHVISQSHVSRRVFVLRWDASRKTVIENTRLPLPGAALENVAPLPPLPEPLTEMAGVIIGEKIYLAGGSHGNGATKTFWSLDLARRKEADGLEWKKLTPWDGPARTHAIAIAQHDGSETCLFLFSGRANAEGKWVLHHDAHKYTPSKRQWTQLRDIQLKGKTEPRCIMAGTGAPWGANHLLVIGGADGKRFLELTGDLPQAEKLKILTTHDGFSRDVLLYNCVTDRWSLYDSFPEDRRLGSETITTGSHVTTPAVRWGDAVVIPSGETSPGVRTPNVWQFRKRPATHSFGTANWVVMGVYLALLLAIGAWVFRKGKTADDFFLAGRRIPWWAAGVSIFSTQLSAITYLSIPAKTYSADWVRFLLNVGILMVAPLVVTFFLPFYRKMKGPSFYEYLERRFSRGIRLIGSLSFVLFQLFRMGIVVLLPGLALSAVTGLEVTTCIILMGLLATAYTVAGGIEAVIWTDVLQTVVLLGGALVAFIIIAGEVGGVGAITSAAAEQGKLNWANWNWDFTSDAILVVFIGALITSILPYTTDQANVQRCLSTPDEKSAARAIYTNAVMVIPVSVLFFGLGTALFIFYQQTPEALGPIAKADQILPTFIVSQMPEGLAGLVIAGVFAASMSSLDSSMHSVATVITTDFLKPRLGDRDLLPIARWVTLALGVLGTASALYLAQQDVKHLWDHLMGFIGLLLGSLFGLFTLGIFTTRTAAKHAWCGLIVCVASMWWVKTFTELNPLLFGVVGTLACLIAAVIASRLAPAEPNDTTGLTWATRQKDIA